MLLLCCCVDYLRMILKRFFQLVFSSLFLDLLLFIAFYFVVDVFAFCCFWLNFFSLNFVSFLCPENKNNSTFHKLKKRVRCDYVIFFNHINKLCACVFFFPVRMEKIIKSKRDQIKKEGREEEKEKKKKKVTNNKQQEKKKEREKESESLTHIHIINFTHTYTYTQTNNLKQIITWEEANSISLRRRMELVT